MRTKLQAAYREADEALARRSRRGVLLEHLAIWVRVGQQPPIAEKLEVIRKALEAVRPK